MNKALLDRIDEIDEKEMKCQGGLLNEDQFNSLFSGDTFSDFDDDFNKDFDREERGEYTPVDGNSEPLASDQVEEDGDYWDDDDDEDDDWVDWDDDGDDEYLDEDDEDDLDYQDDDVSGL